VPGVFNEWGHPRNIIHLTSRDLIHWDYQSTLPLASDRVIDASVFQLPDGNWRMYYNNERAGKSMFYADSPDLYHWTDAGKQIIRDRGEGAKVFRWKDRYWMLIDAWDGLGVFSSSDMTTWQRQEKNILREAGTGKDDGEKGQHCDVVVSGDRAYVFYFVHQNERVTRLQVAELKLENGEITCDRNQPTYIDLSLSMATARQAQTVPKPAAELTVNAKKAGAVVQPDMYGIFFEDINFAADGGLYAELVKNRSFDFTNTPLMGWNAYGRVEVRNDGGPFDKNPHYVRLTNQWALLTGTGLINEGFAGGMGIRQDETYRFSVYARSVDGAPQKILAELIDSKNNPVGRVELDVVG
jgi:hypothetical protein